MRVSLRLWMLLATVAFGALSTLVHAQLPAPPFLRRPLLLGRFPAQVRAAEAAGATYPAPASGKQAKRNCVGETLLIKAMPLERQSTVQQYRLTTIAHTIPDDGKPFYPSQIPLPAPGAWLLIASVGHNWGCFLFVV